MAAAIQFLVIFALLLREIYGKEFHIRNLECFNDYASEFTCSWEVANSNSICSADFELKYGTDKLSPRVCTPQNRENGGAVVPNQCVCKVSNFSFAALLNITVNLESNGTSVKRDVFPALYTVIPKVPRNVTVTSINEDEIEVTWDHGYSESKYSFLSEYLIYNLLVTCKQDPTQLQSINVKNKSYRIGKMFLKSGCNYDVKVRAIKKEKDGVQTLRWSDWSSAVEWHNDYSPSVNILSIVIPVCSIVLLLLISLCYCIITIGKKKWWQNIPDPAKSSLRLIRKRMSQETVAKPDENANIYPSSNKQENAKRTCTNWFNKFFKAHHKKKHFSQDSTSKVYEHSIPQYLALVPEVSVVEIATVENHLQESQKNSVNETKDVVEDKDELFFDLSIDQMFQDIIDDSPLKAQGLSTTRDTFKNSNNNMLQLFALLEDQPAPLEGLQESAYRSYPCDNSDQYSADQQHSLHCTSQESLYQTSETKLDNGYANNGCQANTYCDSGYSSFANAVSSSDSYTTSSDNSTYKNNASSNTSDCLSRSAFGNSNSSLDSNTTDSVYYNRQSTFFSSDTGFYKSGSKMNVELTLTPLPEGLTMCNTSPKEGREVSYPMTTCKASGYQSFAEAILQDGTSINHHSVTVDSLVLEPGYKSFESLLNQNTLETESDTESSVCDLDISVQKEEPTQSSAQNTGTHDLKNMKNTGGQTKIDFAEAPAQEITFGFLNLHLTENCLDSGCKNSSQDEQPSSTKDHSDQILDKAMKAEELQNDLSLICQEGNNCHVPFAWTPDLSEQWKHFANMYEPNFPQSSPVGKIDRIIRGSLSYHTDKGKSVVPETDIGTFPHQPTFSDFNNTSDCQTMKFGNMSYFVHPLKTKLHDTQDDLGTFSFYTPEHHKNHENEDCSYMQISLQ
ncbi:uncharacterized protein LOC108701563 [Xenopus laevis]|uniref:Interleukin-4 receptor subunit alpha n=2 Tax=Xenopus laevis TaxID=8355 RepID=A0A974C0C3_XENLA|nr:uncharacterized protein LOC108701563 [Xenopus laevis]OCT64149.1 hypothetical protein XELAEV_18045250mg [Xenopus laevis]